MPPRRDHRPGHDDRSKNRAGVVRVRCADGSVEEGVRGVRAGDLSGEAWAVVMVAG